MSERAQPELSARALIARVSRVYMAPRWKGWVTALLAAIGVAYCSTQLIHLLKPNSELKILEGEGHFMIVSSAIELADHIREFLNRGPEKLRLAA